jgi:hypothetical protein
MHFDGAFSFVRNEKALVSFSRRFGGGVAVDLRSAALRSAGSEGDHAVIHCPIGYPDRRSVMLRPMRHGSRSK